VNVQHCLRQIYARSWSAGQRHGRPGQTWTVMVSFSGWRRVLVAIDVGDESVTECDVEASLKRERAREDATRVPHVCLPRQTFAFLQLDAIDTSSIDVRM